MFMKIEREQVKSGARLHDAPAARTCSATTSMIYSHGLTVKSLPMAPL